MSLPGANIVVSLMSLRDKRVLTDVTLVIGSTSIPAHKIVLVAGSKYFEKLFTSKNFSSVGILFRLKV